MAGDEGQVMYVDPRRGIRKKALARDGRLFAVRLAGEARAEHWLKAAMAGDSFDPAWLRLALAPSAKPPATAAPREIVCKCADVSLGQIRAASESGLSWEGVRETLGCGSFCGGCLPEVKRLVAEYAPRNAVAA